MCERGGTMKLTIKKFVLVSFIVFLCCFLYGCQPKNNSISGDSSKVTDENTKSSSPGEGSSGAEDQSSTVESMAVGEQPVLRNYMLYVVNLGKVECTKEIQKYTDGKTKLSEVYLNLLEELASYIGYDLIFNSVSVDSQRVRIDLDQSSALFHEEEYSEEIVKPVKYANYEDMVFGILDSMMMTIQENHGSDIDVVYTANGEMIELPEVSMEVEFTEDAVYHGWEYYKNLYLSRAEGQITYIVDLGMPYNEVLVRLNEREIETTQEEDFSMLGDQSSWETYNDVDEYLRNAWLHLNLHSDSYDFVFDGPESTLMGINVTKKQLPSARGLLVGDNFKRLVELYGDAYTMYVIEGSLLYEYQLEDCYFRAFVDATEEYVQRDGVATYSQSEVIRGQEILDEIGYKQELKKEVKEAEDLGLR